MSLVYHIYRLLKVPRCMELQTDCTFHPVFNTPACVFPDVSELRGMVELFYSKNDLSRRLQPVFLISGMANTNLNQIFVRLHSYIPTYSNPMI